MTHSISTHKYIEVARAIETRVKSGEFAPGMFLPPEQELARLFSVSRLTVRRAMTLLIAQGTIVREHGRGSVVVPPIPKPLSFLYIGSTDSHFYADIYLALTEATRSRGQTLRSFAPPGNNVRDWQARLKAEVEEVDVAVTTDESYEQAAPALERKGLRVVYFGWREEHLRAPGCAIMTDLTQGMELAVGHLARLGHRRIALGAWFTKESFPDGTPYSEPFAIYYAAYRASLVRHRIENWDCVVKVEGDGAAARMEDLLRKREGAPTAFVCTQDFRARAIYVVADKMGLRIPRDLSVVGMYDTPWAQSLIPELTSVNYGGRAMAELAVAMATAGIPATTVSLRIAPHLVERSSCAPPVG